VFGASASVALAWAIKPRSSEHAMSVLLSCGWKNNIVRLLRLVINAHRSSEVTVNNIAAGQIEKVTSANNVCRRATRQDGDCRNHQESFHHDFFSENEMSL
jgi:hypothetical protein